MEPHNAPIQEFADDVRALEQKLTADFNPQPDPPGKYKPTEDFNPQPDPPGRSHPTPEFNPQPDPPGKQKL